ncbi:MAG: hypothetical protein IBJ10_03525 [Phycisphaerales bacterium]|nr:hypothetical protein [Phycisphaerales bacterium]
MLHSPLGELSAEYDKVHPFSISGEDRAFSGGERVRVVPIGGDGALICPLICYDLRFPELFRAGRMLGAEVFVVIANWPAPRIEHWRALSIARAIENQAFVIAVNRVGADPMTTYPGRSLVVGPRGDVLLETGGETGLFAAEIAVSEARAWRVKFPIWRDSRPGLLPRLDADGRFDGRSMGEKPRS